MPIYLMEHEEGGKKRERLVEATSIQTARNHVARGIIFGGIAKPADLFRLAKLDVELEKAGAEEPEPKAEEPPAEGEAEEPKGGKGGKPAE